MSSSVDPLQPAPIRATERWNQGGNTRPRSATVLVSTVLRDPDLDLLKERFDLLPGASDGQSCDDANKSRDQGVLDQVLARILTNETIEQIHYLLSMRGSCFDLRRSRPRGSPAKSPTLVGELS